MQAEQLFTDALPPLTLDLQALSQSVDLAVLHCSPAVLHLNLHGKAVSVGHLVLLVDPDPVG